MFPGCDTQNLERIEVVSADSPMVWRYNKHKEVIFIKFKYRYWNKFGIPQHYINLPSYATEELISEAKIKLDLVICGVLFNSHLHYDQLSLDCRSIIVYRSFVVFFILNAAVFQI